MTQNWSTVTRVVVQAALLNIYRHLPERSAKFDSVVVFWFYEHFNFTIQPFFAFKIADYPLCAQGVKNI